MTVKAVVIHLSQYQSKQGGLLWKSKTLLCEAVPPSIIVLYMVVEALLDHMVGREGINIVEGAYYSI